MSNNVVRQDLDITVADLCTAIAEGRLAATREDESFYAIRHNDLMRFLSAKEAGLQGSGQADRGS